MKESKLLSLQQAAELAGMAKAAFFYHIRAGHVKATRWNRYWMIEPESVLRFLRERGEGRHTGNKRNLATH